MSTTDQSNQHSLQSLLLDPDHEHVLAENMSVLRDEISRFLFIRDKPGPVDICVVLGAPSFTNVDPAIFLYQSGLVEHIMITGFGPKRMKLQREHVPEYAGLRQRALDAGIPRSAILVEKSATNTMENFINSATLLDLRFGWDNIGSIAIAGKPLHMRRAWMTARAYWPPHLNLLMQPTTGPTDLQADTWWHSEVGIHRVLAELNSIARYSSRGDIGGI